MPTPVVPFRPPLRPGTATGRAPRRRPGGGAAAPRTPVLRGPEAPNATSTRVGMGICKYLVGLYRYYSMLVALHLQTSYTSKSLVSALQQTPGAPPSRCPCQSPGVPPQRRWRCPRLPLVAPKMGSTPMGPLQKYSILKDWGKRYALALLGRQKQVNGSTQKVPLSKNMKFAVTPLVLTPFVPFRSPESRQRLGEHLAVD